MTDDAHEDNGDDERDSFDDLLREVAHAPSLSLDEGAAASSLPLEGRMLARFRIVERVGRGGMGVVYKAIDERLERVVALKVLVGAYADGTRKRMLLDEARAAAAVNHPNVAEIYDVDEADGVAFIAMAYVEGCTLRERLRKGAMSLEEALDVARQVASGLERAHALRIVHRDLKPDNVMIGAAGRVTILDFGLARPLATGRGEGEAEAETTIAGTPAYMPPEQARGEPADARSDVFSFAVLVHEIATGRLPFEPGDPRHRAAPVIDPRLPPALRALLERALSPSANARPEGGAELVRALGRVGKRRAWVPMAAFATIAVASVFAAVFALTRDRAAPAIAPAAPLSVSPPIPKKEAVREITGALRRLTANPADLPVLHAELSPRGEKLAMVDKRGVVIQSLDGAPPKRIERIGGAVPELVAWFPDEQRIAVTTHAADASTRKLVIYDTASGATRELLTGAFSGLRVSPDGARIAFAEDNLVGWMTTDGARVVRGLVKKDAGCWISELAWSPDSARIAFGNQCFVSLAATTIESIGAFGTSPTSILEDPRLALESVQGGLVWLANGDLVFSRAEWLPSEPGSNLWSVHVDPSTGAAEGEPLRITQWTSVHASALSADARSSKLAFIKFESQVDVYVGELKRGGHELGTPRRLTRTDRNERPATWSLDGKTLFYFSDASAAFRIFAQGIDGAHEPSPLPTFDSSVTFPQAYPDGASLLFWRFPKDAGTQRVFPELVKSSLTGEAPTPVLRAANATYASGAGRPQPWEARFRCAKHANKRCVLAEREGDVLVFRELDAVAGRKEALHRIEHPTAASFLWDLSPDGEALAIVEENGPLRVVSVHGVLTAERSLPKGCDPIYPAFSADGAGVFVAAECSSAPLFRLFFTELARPMTTLLWESPPAWILQPEPSPDGRHLALTVKETDNDVWLLDLAER